MTEETPLICPFCKKDTGWKRECLRYLYIAEPFKCKFCENIIIPKSSNISYIKQGVEKILGI